jgi:hypothetical protein
MVENYRVLRLFSRWILLSWLTQWRNKRRFEKIGENLCSIVWDFWKLILARLSNGPRETTTRLPMNWQNGLKRSPIQIGLILFQVVSYPISTKIWVL